MLNHLRSALPEQWVCLPDCASRLRPGSFPVQRPSPAPSIYLRSEQRGAPRSCAVLSEPKQPPLAAFYPYHRSSRGGLSFGSAVGQNGKPSAFGCKNNILGRKNRKNEARDATGDGDVSRRFKTAPSGSALKRNTRPQRPTVTPKTDCVNMPADQPQSKQRCHTVRVPSPGRIKQEGGRVLSKPTMCKLNRYLRKQKNPTKFNVKTFSKTSECLIIVCLFKRGNNFSFSFSQWKNCKP